MNSFHSFARLLTLHMSGARTGYTRRQRLPGSWPGDLPLFPPKHANQNTREPPERGKIHRHKKKKKKEKASGSWPINTREIGFWIFDALHQTCEIFQELLTLIWKWNNPTYHDECVSWIVKVFPGVSRKYFELAHFYILFSALLFVFVFCQFPFRAFLFPPVSLFKAQPVGQVFLTRHQLLCFFKRRFMKFHFRCFVDVSWLQWVFFHVFLNVVSLDRFLRLPVFVSPASRVNQSSPFTRVLCGCTCLPR